uniref:Ribonuclease H n=1 Tax=viral metagenome TaxID=1070528 RepID=A0A6C0GZV3_9ZZZZ
MYRHIQELKNNPATENLGMKWSEEEINVLLIEIKTNIELEIIALNHKRTIGSIRGKLYNIAEHYINDKKININEVSKIVNIPVIKINEYLEKDNNKYYVVIKGRVPGVYDTWKECSKQVFKYSHAHYKSYKTKKEAEEVFNSEYVEADILSKEEVEDQSNLNNLINHGKAWTKIEIKELIEFIKNKNINEVSNELVLKHKRSISAIKSMLYHIGSYYQKYMKYNDQQLSDTIGISIEDINNYYIKYNKKVPPKLKHILDKFNNIETVNLIKESEQEVIVEPKIIKLNTQQQEAIDSFREKKSIFLTGPAGTGKSVTLKEIIKFCEQENKKFGVTATTGTAAFLISGKTLHSYLGIGLGKDSPQEIFEFVRYKLKHVADKLRELDVLIIDEISMLDKELFQKISKYLSLLRKNSKPFGGLQLVLTGDFCQLEPINGEYCFLSDIWKQLNMETIYLHKLIRQDGDTKFQKMLSNFRYGICSEKNYQTLSSLKDTEFGDVKPTKLYPRNVDVDRINKEEYDKLIKSGAEMIKYETKLPACSKKNKEKSEKWIKSLELPEFVELCVGAQVVVLANIDQDAGIVNGTRGVIISLNKNKVIIKRVNGSKIDIQYYKTTNIEDETLVVQYIPLKLAYALSIHRSQGMTLDAIEIDIGQKIFAAGQAYTALSRAQCLKSVKVVAISKNSFIINKDVLEFYNKIENDLKDKNDKYIKSIINMVIYNLANHIELNNTLDFIWEFISGDDDETLDFFDEYNYEKLKLDYMEYEIKAEDDKINKLIKMVHNTKRYMLNDIDLVKDKLLEFELS